MSKISLLPVLPTAPDGSELVPVVKDGENYRASMSALAQPWLDEVEAAAQAVSATANFHPSQAAGEAAAVAGDLFSYPAAGGGIIIAQRTAGGSTVLDQTILRSRVLPTFDSTAALAAATHDAACARVATRGFFTVNDGGAAHYTRWTAGMAALPAPAEGVWWFTAADASKWQIAEGQTYFTPMFGAMGDPALTLTSIAQAMAIGTNDQPRIQSALDAPMVKMLITTRQHWLGSDLRKPSGKTLAGQGTAITGFHRIPLVGNQGSPTFGIYAEDDDSGTFFNFFFNVQRSGWNAALATDDAQHLNNRCSGIVVRRDCRNVLVWQVDVYNAWGYSHYSTAGAAGNAGPTPRGTRRMDCRAFNGATCFQTTSLNATEKLIDCKGYKDPVDGGTAVYTECGFHSYSGVARIHRIRCSFEGNAPAVLDSIADGVNSGTIINQDCLFRTTGGQAAITVNNPDPDGTATNPANAGKKVLDYRVLGCEVTPDLVFTGGATPFAILATYANVTVRGGKLGGIGVQSGAGAAIIVKGGPDITVSRPDGEVAVTALGTDGSGTIDWFGKAGSITATHGGNPALAKLASDFGVTFHDRPVDVTPAFPPDASGTPIGYLWSETWVKQTGADGAVNIIANGNDADGNYVYWVSQLLDPVPQLDGSGHWYAERIEHEFSWRAPFASDITTNVTVKAHILWTQRDNANVGLTITTKQAIPAGARLVWTMRERAA